MEHNNRKDRNTLKTYFKKGQTPTEGQFAELIDSMTNIVEDGQIAGTGKGWTFCPKQDGTLELGLYTDESATETGPPVWTIAVTPEKKLLIRNTGGETVLEAAQDKSVILHGSLTVEDGITATAYKTGGGGEPSPGGEEYVTIPADKQWHDLPIDVSREGFGCRVYRIYASFREQGTGLCRLTRVTAIWQNRMEQQIESPQKHWWGWSGSVRFRWEEHGGTPCLQMRSKKKLPSGEVHCRIVKMYKG